MSTIKQQVIKEFPDAKCVSVKKDMFAVKSSKGNGISKYSEEEAWLDFKLRTVVKHLNYKELVLEKFRDAKIVPTDHKWFVKVETNDFRNQEDAWQAFYEQYCTYKPDLIIGNKYEFSNDGDNWFTHIFDSYNTIQGHKYLYIRPIQNNPKLDQLKQLAEELGYNLTKQ